MTLNGVGLWFYHDDSGTPYALYYGGAYYYYATNAQGDVTAILNSSCNTVATYSYDAWGNPLAASGTHALANLNPLRYRGYVYDFETELYYLQSRYYNPEMGRFLNADAYTSTGQGILGNNMFSYCQNNPANYWDLNGERLVGIGFQLEVQLGDVTVGVEVIVYFDSTICGEADFVVVKYSYSGVDISVTNMAKIDRAIESITEMIITEAGDKNWDAIFGHFSAILNGLGGSGALFAVTGNEKFTRIQDYSGSFETTSLSGSYKGAKVTGFHSYSSCCDTYGLKVGVSIPGLRKPLDLPVDISYSRTDYSNPEIMWRIMI